MSNTGLRYVHARGVPETPESVCQQLLAWWHKDRTAEELQRRIVAWEGKRARTTDRRLRRGLALAIQRLKRELRNKS